MKRARFSARKFRHFGPHLAQPFVADAKRDQIRLREIPVVVRLLLAAHADGLAEIRVIEARFLNDACRRFR